MPRKFALFPILICLSIITSPAQSLTKEDYARAVSFLWTNIENKTAFNLSVSPHWLADSTGFWWENNNDKGKTYELVLFANPQSQPLFDHQKVAAGLSNRMGEVVDPNQLPIANIEFPARDKLRLRVKGSTYLLDLKTYTVSNIVEKNEERSPFSSPSPDGKWIAYSEDYNLFLKSVTTDKVFQLSHNGKKGYEYGSYYGWFDIMEGENGDRPKRFSVNWSPDSKYIQTTICDLRSANKMYMLDWSVDTLFRPNLLSYYRGSPGDTTMVYMTPIFYDVDTKMQLQTKLPRNTHINGVSFRWSAQADKVYAKYDERGFHKAHILQLDLAKNKQTTLVTESCETNIDNFDYWLVEKKGKLVFSSERSGWKQLYSQDLVNGKITPITNGNYYVNGIERIDQESGTIFFLASGKEQGRNPYHQHLYKIDLDGTKLSLLTPENTHHQIDFSPNGQYFFDNYSTANIPTQSVLREANTGNIVLKVAQANIDALQSKNWKAPQLFEAIARDGKTPIYGALWKPTHFNPNRKYPIIDHSYTGPHTQMFPKDFRRVLSVGNQALAELGFIVIMVDGLGTAGRSKAFHDHSYKNMGLNLADHVLAIRQMAQKHPWIDIERVGIFGHSAGGYDAGHAVLQFPEFYKVAVASSADHDFRMEKAWWPEMYMGWPVDDAYDKVSNITMAKNLKGKLLLVHGGLDDNVNASATFKLAEALVKADKQFDLLILPSQRHGYQGIYMDYFRKRRWNYFVEHLLGVEPIWDFEWK
ncbi:MAG: prolyl oligopeptidase family serine peptidase [Saprospiraceae bacterium]